jgi:hypothetical protein
VLEFSDTFHYHNLPDLILLIRSTLMGMCCNAWLQRLFNIFLCGKRYKRIINTSDASVQLTSAIINTLHGSLLGLYPLNERRMDIRKRAWIAGNVREIMTSKKGHMQFINEHPFTISLCLAEYILNVVNDFCPVEWELMGVSANTRSQVLAGLENFRENTVSTFAATDLFWEKLEADAVPIVSSISKCFANVIFYQHSPRSIIPASMMEFLPLALESRIVQNSSSIFGQLKASLPDIQFKQSDALEEIWTTVYVRHLPASMTFKQIQTLENTGKMCSIVQEELHHFPMCMRCALTRKLDVTRALFRFDTVNSRLMCGQCTHTNSVVNINLLGRVLYVRDFTIVLCELCLRAKYWNSPCPCAKFEDTNSRLCCVCDAVNITSSKDIIDIERMEMRTVHFCYKHTLTCVFNEATLYDFKTLENELHASRTQKTSTSRKKR